MKHHGVSGVLSALWAAGLRTVLRFGSLAKQELGTCLVRPRYRLGHTWDSLATLICKESARLVRPENTSPCSLKSDEMLFLQTGLWIDGICCLCSAYCQQNVQSREGDFFSLPQTDGCDFLLLPGGVQHNYVRSDQTLALDASQPVAPLVWGWQRAFPFASQGNVHWAPPPIKWEHCTFVPRLILMSLKILSCLANTGQDIDSLSFGCEWLFVKSIDSAVRLSWTTLRAQNMLLLLLSTEN